MSYLRLLLWFSCFKELIDYSLSIFFRKTIPFFMECFSYSLLGKKETDAIRHIRHAVNCSFHKEWNRFSKKDRQRVINQFFKTTKPQKKP